MAPSHRPIEITLYRDRRLLALVFDDGARIELPAEYLRVYSPASEVAGYHRRKPVLQVGKAQVNICDVVPVGRYAVKLVFDDGHQGGVYTWDYLYELGADYAARWADYLARLERAGQRREA